ncbi:hypothetical protein U0C82_12850 [Fulvimarina sp. 2208YS6-2-32]|uniref:Transcriptional regulator n=1 Tax=Fulvimarina uroteuthidis TaxID=3098149 RepID=A0ABU5I3R8_9HYPH|nr:hypothetical protein [Fulvimarina sp. 2208YS6-2-32]MDY8110029.1 hypothetical protein [Fulvimarina sp. 2208YS6-2-32]
MDNSRRARENAEALLPGPTQPHRSEKGTAGGIIAADLAARHAKTDRLRAARLAQEAVDPPVETEKKPARAKRATKAVSATAKPVKKAAAKPRKKAVAV